MLRLAIVIAIVCVEGVVAIEVARTSKAIASAEPRDIPVFADWFDLGTMSAGEDGIHYQPILCAMMGADVSRFVKWHERCHYWHRSGSRRQQEDDADTCAARHATREATKATIKWLWEQNDRGDDAHRPSRDRARLIARALS